jgi:hypothetical protein
MSVKWVRYLPGWPRGASPEGSVGFLGTYAPAVWLVFPAGVRWGSLVGMSCDKAGCGGGGREMCPD